MSSDAVQSNFVLLQISNTLIKFCDNLNKKIACAGSLIDMILSLIVWQFEMLKTDQQSQPESLTTGGCQIFVVGWFYRMLFFGELNHRIKLGIHSEIKVHQYLLKLRSYINTFL